MLPFTLNCKEVPLSRPETITFMPTYEPLPAPTVPPVTVPEDELWEEPVPATYELDESVRSSLQAPSAALHLGNWIAAPGGRRRTRYAVGTARRIRRSGGRGGGTPAGKDCAARSGDG